MKNRPKIKKLMEMAETSIAHAINDLGFEDTDRETAYEIIAGAVECCEQAMDLLEV